MDPQLRAVVSFRRRSMAQTESFRFANLSSGVLNTFIESAHILFLDEFFHLTLSCSVQLLIFLIVQADICPDKESRVAPRVFRQSSPATVCHQLAALWRWLTAPVHRFDRPLRATGLILRLPHPMTSNHCHRRLRSDRLDHQSRRSMKHSASLNKSPLAWDQT